MSSFEISWIGKHFGEEPPISGERGSGTVFFCRCNLKCVYCQNWQISHEGVFCKTVSEAQLVKAMLSLQEKGVHNINLVSPTIWASKLKETLKIVKAEGLAIPVVWNTNAYETVQSLEKLEGLIDIYLPDYKYSQEDLAVKYSNCPGYPRLAKEAILEMQHQVGDLKISENGIAQKGLIVRHLMLPGNLDNTKRCLEFIRSISLNVHLSLMSQYNPTYKAKDFPEINRVLTQEEFEEITAYVEELGFKYGWVQEFGGAVKCLTPDFNKENPFA